jgi:hypothetical protein
LAYSATLGDFPYFRAAQKERILFDGAMDLASEDCGFPFTHSPIDDSSAPN